MTLALASEERRRRLSKLPVQRFNFDSAEVRQWHPNEIPNNGAVLSEIRRYGFKSLTKLNTPLDSCLRRHQRPVTPFLSNAAHAKGPVRDNPSVEHLMSRGIEANERIQNSSSAHHCQSACEDPPRLSPMMIAT
ncbi:predicted protein [Coccidioides posadasii str. Silveira]|uniref:Predicted protein n=1 Tax=Coccidioides posadasii (strain RMSCC 757 / Silveira) TaxID=443226 RepID=E9DC97_COCPS|nr:predicted protein [Coccidioides posadasii str. Silveira]